MAWRMDAMIRKCPCLRPEVEEVRMLDFKHCSLADVPNEIFNFERTLEELYLDANQIHDLPRPLFHCHELRILGLSDNDVHSLPQAIASLINLEELDISKNGVLDIPDNIKGCKCLRILEASVNPLGKLPDGFTQLINLEELYLNDTFVDFLPANFGRLTKLRILELRENHLKSLPKSMARLTELTRLDIGQNDFREMPDVIGSLPKLTELWCDCNRLSSVPSFVGNLRRLTYLEVSQNRIESLPVEIENCVNLTDMTLSSNSLKTLPESIGCLVNLSTLRVDDNRLQKLPNSIGSLTNLEEFVLSQNDLKCLPASIGLLRKMHTFIIDDNLLESLPPEMGSCASLTILSARCNRLTRIPDELGHIPRLRIVNLCDNRITFLPFSITKLRNLQALWLSENQNKPLIPLQSDIDIDTGQRVLTCFLLPQVHQRPCEDHHSDSESVRLSGWDQQRPQRQHIKFAPDEKLDKPGKLIRNPTPYPKELKAHAKHARNNQAIKTKSANYANIESLNDDESNPSNDPDMAVVQETAVWMPSMPITVKEARVTKPKSPHMSPKLHEQPSDKKLEESAYGRQQKKHLMPKGRGRISSDSSSMDVFDGRERSNSVNDFPADPAVNCAIGSPVTVGKFASLPELSAATAQLKMNSSQIKKPNGGGRGLAVKEAKHQRSYSSGILRKLENLKQGRQHKYEGLKNAACRSDQDLYLNLREANGHDSVNQDAGVVSSATSTPSDGYSSDWEAVVARRYGNAGNSPMTFGQAKRPASISAATTRPVTGRWNTPSPPMSSTNYRQQLVGSYSRLLCGGSPRASRAASPADRSKLYKNDGIKGGENYARTSNSPLPRPPPDVLPRSSGQYEPPVAGVAPSAAISGRFPPSWPGRHGVAFGPCLPPKFAPDPPSLPPRSKPYIPPPTVSSDAGVPSPQSYIPRHSTASGTVPPSPNRNRKPPPYHIAATYSRQIGDQLLGSQSSETVGHPYARPPSGPPSPHGTNLPVLRFNNASSSNGTYSTPSPSSSSNHHPFRRSATPPFSQGRSVTPPFPPVHPVTQTSLSTGDQFRAAPHWNSGGHPCDGPEGFPQLAVPGDVSVGSPRPQPPPVSTTNAVVNGAVVYNNPYINDQPPPTNRSPSPASHSPESSGSHRSGRSSGDRGSIKSKRSSSSSCHLVGQQSPQQEHSIYARRMWPKVPPSSPAGTPRSSASSNSSCDMTRTPLRPLAPLNVFMLPRSLSAPSTPPSVSDHHCSPSPPAPPYRTPPLYHSISIGNLDMARTGHNHPHPSTETREHDAMRGSSNRSPPNLLKKCRMSQEQRTSPVSSHNLYANTRNAESPKQVNALDSGTYGMVNSNIYGQTTAGRVNAFPVPTNGSAGAASQLSPGSGGRSPAWMSFGESSAESRAPPSVDLVDPSQYGIFTAHPVLVDSCGSRDETSASDVENKPRSSSNNWSALTRGSATVFSNPYAGGEGGSSVSHHHHHHPPNLTQDKLSQRGGSAPLIVPTPHRPAGPFSTVAKHNQIQSPPATPPLRYEGDSLPASQPPIPSYDKHFVDRQVVLLKKQSPWLFGQHRNPKVIPVVIQKNPDLGFSITQYQNGSPQPFESAICVASVTPEGAASTVLKPGDKLLQVDGKDISRLDLQQARRVLQDTGSTVFMMVSR